MFSCDLRSLALVRICLGGTIILDLLIRSLAFSAHYTDAGILPRSALLMINSYSPASLHMISGSPWVTGVLFLFAAAVGFLLMAGYRSRLMVFISWVLLISLDARNEYVSQGGDLLLRMLLFWAMFLPMGARFSIDAAMDKSPVTSNQHFSFASLGLLIQVLSVYFFTALLKDDPVWIPQGTAVYYALSIDPLVTPIGAWLLQFPTLLTGLTYIVWALEILSPLLVFSPFFHLPLRLCALALLILMHIGFFVCMNIGLFPLISIISLLALMPPAVWEWFGRRFRMRERSGIRIYYDGECLFCEKTCLILRTLLILPDTTIAPAQSRADVEAIMLRHDSWVVYDRSDNHYLRWKAVAWLVSQSPLFAPIGKLLASRILQRLGEKFYAIVAANRYHLSGYARTMLPFRPVDTQLSTPANLVCALFIVVVFWHNLGTLRSIDVEVPATVRTVINSLRLSQSWSMFAPAPSDTSGWFVAVGKLDDGRSVDIFQNRISEPTWSRQIYLDLNYSHYRWRKYLSRLPLEERVETRPFYLQYLCRQWNAKHRDVNLAWVKLYFVAEKTRAPGQVKTSERVLTWKSNCGVDPVAQVLNLRNGVLPETGFGGN